MSGEEAPAQQYEASDYWPLRASPTMLGLLRPGGAVAFVVAGFLTGIIGGLFGVGGGEIFIPLLIYLFGFSQHQAQGTSLAVLLPPIGLLAALRYYHAGHVDFKVAGLLALGFFFGASLGAIGATRMHADILRRVFGVFLLIISVHMILGHRGERAKAATIAAAE
jgi:uncharacterized membrane protein YfcA